MANFIILLLMFLISLLTFQRTFTYKHNVPALTLYQIRSYKCTLSKKVHTKSNARLFSSKSFEYKKEDIHPDLLSYLHYFPNLTNKQILQLNMLISQLVSWNDKVNLISRKDINNIVLNHILPSLSISLVKKFNDEDTIIDIGTGGGLPGLPTAILFPKTKVTLLDSNSKKMGIVQDIASQLGLENVNCVTSRAEAHTNTQYQYLIGRAVSAIPNFLSFSSHLIEKNKSITSISTSITNNNEDINDLKSGLLYLKGGDFKQELLDAKILDYQLYPVNSLLPTLTDCDKSVLYIPASEIHSFQHRMNILK